MPYDSEVFNALMIIMYYMLFHYSYIENKYSCIYAQVRIVSSQIEGEWSEGTSLGKEQLHCTHSIMKNDYILHTCHKYVRLIQVLSTHECICRM